MTRDSVDTRLRKIEQDLAALASSVRTWAFAVGVFFTIVQIGLNIRGKRSGDAQQKR